MHGSRDFFAPRATAIFQPGQPCPGFVILSQGTIRVSLTRASGRDVVLYRVTPGDVCMHTLSCRIDPHAFAADGVAETDLKGPLVPAETFHQKLAEDAAFRDMILRSVSARFAEYKQLIEDVALMHFDARLAKALLRLTGPDRTMRATHADLASETASGRAYVSRRLAECARQGWVAQQKDGIALLNREALDHVVMGTR
ncbi:MAG: Crp/Fnr family transcriptional regulator [Rhodobacteraceae bacterium]|nr:Crp/Fnr family transcriptional regulator [Paracoccaceae bacterium]